MRGLRLGQPLFQLNQARPQIALLAFQLLLALRARRAARRILGVGALGRARRLVRRLRQNQVQSRRQPGYRDARSTPSRSPR
jgi:hypothetical protein